MEIDVESIKKECIKIFNALSDTHKSSLVEESMISITNLNIDFSTSFSYNSSDAPSSMLPPIYYLFDHEINHTIGCSSNSIRTLNKYLNIDNMFGLISENIIDVNIPKHSTIIYKIIISDRISDRISYR